MAEPVLDVVAEDPEIEQVAADVPQPAVHEHRREELGIEKYAGTSPKVKMNRSTSAGGRVSCSTNTRALRTTRMVVTTGRVRVGMTSLRGIIAIAGKIVA